MTEQTIITLSLRNETGQFFFMLSSQLASSLGIPFNMAGIGMEFCLDAFLPPWVP